MIVLPGAPPVTHGPYRWLRHPNYVGVALEIAVVPLALGLPQFALAFSLANAAMLGTLSPAAHIDPKEWQRVLDVNLTGYFLCAKHAARVMKRQASGVIIQINSKSGKRGSAKNSAYAASKFGVIGFTKTWSRELGPKGVQVNAVLPGMIETEMSGRVRKRAGEAILARIPAERHENALVVPAAAVTRDTEGAAVYVLNGDVAERTPVKTGIETPEAVEILSGVAEGQTVLTSNIHGLGDKARLVVGR